MRLLSEQDIPLALEARNTLCGYLRENIPTLQDFLSTAKITRMRALSVQDKPTWSRILANAPCHLNLDIQEYIVRLQAYLSFRILGDADIGEETGGRARGRGAAGKTCYVERYVDLYDRISGEPLPADLDDYKELTALQLEGIQLDLEYWQGKREEAEAEIRDREKALGDFVL